jgi:hypothetical protein
MGMGWTTMDLARERLYVCGGRINDWSFEVAKFSGLIAMMQLQERGLNFREKSFAFL